MPKTKPNTQKTQSAEVVFLFRQARKMLRDGSSNPSTNSLIVLNHLFRNLSQLKDNQASSPDMDWEILMTLSKLDYPHIDGNTCSDLLQFDFTLTSDGVKQTIQDLTSFPIQYAHINTLHYLLQEERRTWGSEEQIIQGLKRSIPSEGLTWLHKSLINASFLFYRYKDQPLHHLELKEFLQNTLQVCMDLITKFPYSDRKNMLNDMAVFFAKESPEHEKLMFAFVLSINLGKSLLEDSDYKALFSDLCSGREKHLEQLINIYSLDKDSLIQRQQQLVRIRENRAETETNLDKAFLKVRFGLSILIGDTHLFNECIGGAQDFNMQALLETLYHMSYLKVSVKWGYLISSIPYISTCRKGLDYLFFTHSIEHVSNYFPLFGHDKHEFIYKHICLLLFVWVTDLSNYQDHHTLHLPNKAANGHAYLKAITQAAITHQISHLIENIIYVLVYTNDILSDITRSSVLINFGTKRGVRSPFVKYPLLMEQSSTKFPAFHEKIMKLLDASEVRSAGEESTWFAYITYMNISLALDESSIDSQVLYICQLYFEILDYWFDQLIVNQAKYPVLWKRIQAQLLDTNYFSDSKLKYLWAYRFGEFSNIGFSIEQARLAIGSEPSGTKIDKRLYASLMKYLKSSEEKFLREDLFKILITKKGTIDAQLHFLQTLIIDGELYEDDLKLKYDKYKISKSCRFILDVLIQQTPLAQHIVKWTGSDASPSLFLEKCKSQVESHVIDLKECARACIFDEDASEAFFLLFLLLKKTQHNVISLFMFDMIMSINTVCEEDPLMKRQYDFFYQVMAKNNFFKHELGNLLPQIFYIRNLFVFPESDKSFKLEPLDLVKATHSAKKRKKKNKKAALASVTDTEQMPDPDLQVESSSPKEMSFPVIDAKDFLSPVAVQQAPVFLFDEEISEAPDASSEEGSREEVDESDDNRIQKIALRKAQQELFLIFKQLLHWGQEKIVHFGAESIQSIQYQALLVILEKNQNILRKVRTLVKKFPIDASVVLDSEAHSFQVFEQIQGYGERVKTMREMAVAINVQEIVSFLDEIISVSAEECMQLHLLEHMVLPDMPILKKLRGLFAEHAHTYLIGTSLFLSKPMDIDLCFELKNPALSIEQGQNLFESILRRVSLEEGLDFKIISSKLFIGIASISLKGKGDGYGLSDYKSIDFTIEVADASKRLPKFHHTTHSAARLCLSTGKILCDSKSAAAIVSGIFSIHPAPLIDPTERYKMNVHVVTTLMRAWTESQIRPLRLDLPVIELIEKIKAYKGDASKLQLKEQELHTAFMDMMLRHFKHFECSQTYMYRTSMLINFVTELQMHRFITTAAARALNYIVNDELKQNQQGLIPYIRIKNYLKFCATHPLLSFDVKSSMTEFLFIHFNRHRKEPQFIEKTQALLDLCKELELYIIISDLVGASPVCRHLSKVNHEQRFMVLSAPLTRIEHPSLLFVDALGLLAFNTRAILTAEINKILFTPPPMPSLDEEAKHTVLGGSIGFFAHPQSAAAGLSAAAESFFMPLTP